MYELGPNILCDIPLDVDWLAAILLIWGMILNARKNVWCWVVWIFSSVLWSVHWLLYGEMAALMTSIICMLSNGYGLYRWTHND